MVQLRKMEAPSPEEPHNGTALLYRISETMIGLDTLSTKLQMAADTITEALDADWVIVIRIDLQRRRVLDSVTGGKDPQFTPPFDYQELMQGLTGWAAEHNSALLSSKEGQDSRESPELQRLRREHRAGSIMVAPLRFASKVVGTITVIRNLEQPDFTEDDLRLLEPIANLSATAIENARVYDDLKGELERHRRTEQNLQEREEDLRRALEEKNLLLREVHHRVKNNLAIVESIINLKASELESETAQEMMQDIRLRIDAIRLLHEKLYTGGGGEGTDAREYLLDIVENARSLARGNAFTAELRCNVEEVELSVSTAMYIGLIVTELVTNAVKHAFPGGQSAAGVKPQLQLSFGREGDHYRLTLSDNGKGIQQEKLEDTNGTMGIPLIRTLTEQLGGQLEIDTKSSSGTGWHFRIPAG